MKVIFLDIDGVLNSRRYDAKRDKNGNTNIDETRLPLVKRIVDATGARIVLSSSWRNDWDVGPLTPHYAATTAFISIIRLKNTG